MSLSDFGRLVLRRRFTFLAVLLVALGGATAAVFTLPKQYEASALLFVGQDRPIADSGSTQRDDVLAKSYTALLRAPQVADRAARRIPGQVSRETLLGHMRFEQIAGTQLVSVVATDANPQRAARIANLYADTFVAQRQGTDAATQRSRLDRIAIDLRTSKDPGGARVAALRGAYRALQQSIALEGPNVSRATAAVAPTSPSAPRPVLYLGAALILALTLAALAVLIRDRLDRRIWDEDAVVAIAGVPILARIPVKRGKSSRAGLQAFSFLRANLLAGNDPRTILVTSASAGDGKTEVVRGLSAGLAQAGVSVIAADCDFRAPELSKPFLGESDVGLLDVAYRRAGVIDALVTTDTPGLRVARSGSEGSELPGALNPRTASDLTRRLGESADIVVFDSAPVLAAVDTSVLAAAGMDAVVLVVDLRKTTREALRAAVEQLEQSGALIRGLVLNRARNMGAAEYGYGYGSASRDRNSASSFRGVPFGER